MMRDTVQKHESVGCDIIMLYSEVGRFGGCMTSYLALIWICSTNFVQTLV